MPPSRPIPEHVPSGDRPSADVGDLTHTLNNALCGALGFLELALAEPDVSTAARAYLEVVRSQLLEAARAVRATQPPRGAGRPAGPTPVAPSEPTPLPWRRPRVLVVEDDDGVRRFLEAGLSGLGYLPVVTGGVAEALAALAEGTFDGVLSDLGLPDGSGEDVARAAASLSPAPPVLLLTGRPDRLAGTPPGVRQVLAKPVALADLAAALAAALAV